MTIQEAKENVIKNFRANYTTENNPSVHEIEVFLLNTMEQLEDLKELTEEGLMRYNFFKRLQSATAAIENMLEICEQLKIDAEKLNKHTYDK